MVAVQRASYESPRGASGQLDGLALILPSPLFIDDGVSDSGSLRERWIVMPGK